MKSSTIPTKDKNIAEEELEAIVDAAGWATDSYVANISPLSNKAKYHLLVLLANEGLLFDEDLIDPDTEEKPTEGHMSVKQVKNYYSYLLY